MGAGSRRAPWLPNVIGVTGTKSSKNGAEVLLAQLESQSVDCIFASPIAVMAPIWEALARRGSAVRWNEADGGAGSEARVLLERE